MIVYTFKTNFEITVLGVFYIYYIYIVEHYPQCICTTLRCNLHLIWRNIYLTFIPRAAQAPFRT